MSPTAKKPTKPPAKKSGQQDIRVLVENVRKSSPFKKPLPADKQDEQKPSTSKAKNPAPTPSTSRARNPAPEPIPSTSMAKPSAPEPKPSTSKAQTTPQPSLAARSPYAREIFLAKTNVRELARESVLASKKNDPVKVPQAIIKYCYRLYECYANESKMRLWPPLHKLVFESPYYEYRFFLALNNSMQHHEDYEDYLGQLRGAGLKECWVNMRKNNEVLEDRDKIVAMLQERFTRWNGKLAKLPKYLKDAQEKRERQLARQKQFAELAKSATAVPKSVSSPSKDPELLDALLHRSNCTQDEQRTRKIFRHLHPDSMAADLKWTFGKNLTFESDELNRRYGLGAYRELTPEKQLPPPGPSSVEQLPAAESSDDNSSESEVGSVSSEILQMRSKMAMTQPSVIPSLYRPAGRSQELLYVLDQNLQRATSPTLEPEMELDGAPSVELDGAPSEDMEVAPSEEMEAAPSGEMEVAPSEEIEAAPLEESVEQQPAYDIKFLKERTNLMDNFKQMIEERYEGNVRALKMKNIDSSIRKFAKNFAELLSQRQLPPGYRLLTPGELEERKKVAAAAPRQAQPNRPESGSSAISDAPTKPVELFVLIPYHDSPMDVSVETEPPAKPVPTSEQINSVPESRSPAPSAAQPPEPPSKAVPAPKQGNTVRVKSRPIQYYDSPEVDTEPMDTEPPAGPAPAPKPIDCDYSPAQDSLPMGTDDFIPNDCSTQLATFQHVDTPVVPLARRRTCFVWPEQLANASTTEAAVEHLVTQRMPVRPSPSKAATPARSVTTSPGRQPQQADDLASLESNISNRSTIFASDCPNTTVLEKPNSQPQPVKHEPDTSGYDEDVIHVTLVDPIIEILDESICAPDDPEELIAQHAAAGDREAAGLVMPPTLQERVDCLTMSHSQDPTLSQSSTASSGEPVDIIQGFHSQRAFFLPQLNIASVQFYRNPAAFQQLHHLQVVLNHRRDGCYQLLVHDHEVRKLLHLDDGDRVWRALVAALNRLDRFRYEGAATPNQLTWNRMSITEKVLHLFFATVPGCGGGGGGAGGLMFRRQHAGSYFEPEEVQLENFNYFVHSSENGGGEPNRSSVDLSEGLDPAVRERMKALKKNAR